MSVKVERRLGKVTTFPIPGATRDLDDFYRRNSGVWCSPNFQKFILLGMSQGSVVTLDTKWASANLDEPASDDEIDNDLPQDGVFRKRDLFLGHLATLTSAQPKGGKGRLLTKDYMANIFLVEFDPGVPFAVFVHWYPVDAQWDFGAYPRDALRWNPGARAFGNCP